MRLIIDCNNLAYAAYYSTGILSYDDLPTGVIFGFFNQLLKLAQKFDTDKFIFCWDSRKNHRKRIFPEYKLKRREGITPEEEDQLKITFNQFSELRREILPAVGFRNVFHRPGYESDDIMAWVLLNTEKEETVLVSSDNDMLQMLDYCKIYSPNTKKITTRKAFVEKYNITPKQFAEGKAIGGCSGDEVPGILGVGDPAKSKPSGRVFKYLRGELTSGEIYNRIVSMRGRRTIQRNRKLVVLPFNGPLELKFKIKQDELSKTGLLSCFTRFRFMSFLSDEGWRKWENAFFKR